MVEMNDAAGVHDGRRYPGSVAEVFWAFLRLGVTSFGGPVAHLGYFRDAFVERRKWLSDRVYADLVALWAVSSFVDRCFVGQAAAAV